MLALLAGHLLAQALPQEGDPVNPPVKLVAHSSNAQRLSPDGKELAFNAEFHGLRRFPDDISVRFLSLSTGKVRLSVKCPESRIDDLAWSPDGKSIASLAHDGAVRVIGSKDGAVEGSFATSPDVLRSSWRPRSIAFVDGGTKLLVAGGRSAVQLRARNGGAVVAQFLLKPEAAVSALCISDDCLHFALGDVNGAYAVYSAQTGELEAGPFSGPEPVNALALAPDGARIAVGLGDCKVRLVSLRPDASTVELSHCDQDLLGNLQIGSVAFSPDGKNLLATSYSFYEVRLWSLDSGSVAWHFDYSGGNPTAISARFASDPRLIVVSTGGDIVDAASGKVVRTLSLSSKFVHFSSEGAYAWTTSEAQLRIFDVRTGKRVTSLDLREPMRR